MTNIPDIRDQSEVFDGNTVFENVFILDKLDYDFAKSGHITITDLTVTGIATFGTSSTTIDGGTDTIQVGTALTIGHTQGLQFHTQNLHSTGFEVNQINVSGIATIGSDLYLTGALVDTSGSPGATGKLLQSTGSGTEWIAANATSVNNAINVGVNLNGTNANQFVSFFGANSGNQPNRVDAAFTYNPSTNTMSGINYSGTSTFNNANITGVTTVGTAITFASGAKIYDGDGNFGSVGQVLTSDGTDLKWDASSNLPAGSSAQIAVGSTDLGSPRILLATGTGSQKDVVSSSNLTYNTSTQVIGGKISSLSNHDTDDLSEGSTNLYHTTTRARSSVSASGDLAYNSSTGVFSVNVPSAFQTGMIILWSGSVASIPSGFALCNGQTVNGNTTPNLLDRFIICAGNGYGVGLTGGSSNAILVEHSHTINDHTHGVNINTDQDTHSHTSEITDYKVVATGPRGFGFIGLGGPGGYPGGYPNLNDDVHHHNVNGNTGSPSDRGTSQEGTGPAGGNLPPYYALCYIMKV